MATSIIFNSFAVKIDENSFIPIICSGSSNFRSQNGAYVRSYTIYKYICDTGITTSKEIIKQKISHLVDETLKFYNDVTKEKIFKNFGSYIGIRFYSSGVFPSYNKYLNYFLNLKKKVIPIEELVKQNVFISFSINNQQYRPTTTAELKNVLMACQLSQNYDYDIYVSPYFKPPSLRKRNNI